MDRDTRTWRLGEGRYNMDNGRRRTLGHELWERDTESRTLEEGQ